MGSVMVPNLLALAVVFSNTGSLLTKGEMQKSGGNGFNALLGSDSFPPMELPALPYSPFDPYFDESAPQEVTALVGKAAYLTCRVRNLGNKTVSWIRHRDIHILTVGAYTYTSDQRFQTNFHPIVNEWTLQIKWTQKRDAGTYECQISTQPVMSYFVNLTLVDGLVGDEPSRDVSHKPDITRKVPKATIHGGPDLFVNKGSTINLTCTIEWGAEPAAYIFWYHLEEVISYDSPRGGVSIITEKGDVTTSFLLIQDAAETDSGKYSCSPSNADVAYIHVHVLNGERPAAMQTGSAGLSNSSLNILASMIISYLYWYIYLSLQLEVTETVPAPR